MILRFSAWLNKKPVTKAAWITAIASLLVAIVSVLNTYVIIQNSQTIETSKKALLLMIPPSVEIKFPVGTDDLNLRNTSPYEIINIEVRVSAYQLSIQPKPHIIKRNAGGGENSSTPKLAVGATFKVPNNLLYYPTYQPTEENPVVFALVVAFNRSIDGKRFVKVKPFGAFKDDKGVNIVPLFCPPSSGETTMELISVYQEMEKTEKYIYGADEF